MHHIAQAEEIVERLHREQLEWAASSAEAAALFQTARMRAAHRVASRLGGGPELLDGLRVFFLGNWSIEVDREMRQKHPGFDQDVQDEWFGAASDEDGFDSLFYVLEDLWPDVILETDEWARRVCDRHSDALLTRS